MDFIAQSIQDTYDYMRRILLEDFDDEHILMLAKDCVNQISWTNPALMHKGLYWIIENYLARSGVLFKRLVLQ